MVAPNKNASKTMICAQRQPDQPIEKYCLYCSQENLNSSSTSTDIRKTNQKETKDTSSSTQQIKRFNKYYRNSTQSPIESLILPNLSLIHI